MYLWEIFSKSTSDQQDYHTVWVRAATAETAIRNFREKDGTADQFIIAVKQGKSVLHIIW